MSPRSASNYAFERTVKSPPDHRRLRAAAQLERYVPFPWRPHLWQHHRMGGGNDHVDR